MLKNINYLAIFLIFICPSAVAQTSTTIPFELTEYNNLVIKAVLNQKDTVKLMFHTAASSLTLTEDATKKISSLVFDRTDSVKSWGGAGNSSRFSKSNEITIGSLKWDHVPIWENTNSGPKTDGKFGLELFVHKVIEIDFDKKVIVLHDQLPNKVKDYEKLKLVFEDDMMFLEASCEIEGKLIENKFLIHSGYSGTVLLDDQFTAANQIDGRLKVVDEKSLKDSFGNVLKTKKAILPAFTIGKSKLIDPPVGFFTGSIGRQKMSIIGGDLLKRFNMVIDSDRTYVYLKQNSLMNFTYWKG